MLYALFCQVEEVSKTKNVNWMFYNLYRLMPPLVRGGADKVGGGVVGFDENELDVLQSGADVPHYILLSLTQWADKYDNQAKTETVLAWLSYEPVI